MSDMKDRITVVKSDGREFPNIPALVTPNTIIVMQPDKVPIEKGDHVLRDLPDGATENFMISAANCFRPMGDIPAHYQLKYVAEP